MFGFGNNVWRPPLGSSERVFTYYFADDGNDAGAGTRDDPWQTVNKMNSISASMSAGESIGLKYGDSWNVSAASTGRLDIDTFGTEGSPVVYGAWGTPSDGKPVLDCATGQWIIVATSLNGWVEMENIKFTNAGTDYGIGFGGTSNTTNFTFTDCDFEHSYRGQMIKATGAATLVCTRCTFYDPTPTTLSLPSVNLIPGASVGDATFESCTFTGGQSAIKDTVASGSLSSVYINGCTFLGQRTDYVLFSQYCDVEIWRSYFAEPNNTYWPKVHQADKSLFAYFCIFDASGDGYNSPGRAIVGNDGVNCFNCTFWTATAGRGAWYDDDLYVTVAKNCAFSASNGTPGAGTKWAQLGNNLVGQSETVENCYLDVSSLDISDPLNNQTAASPGTAYANPAAQDFNVTDGTSQLIGNGQDLSYPAGTTDYYGNVIDFAGQGINIGCSDARP